MGEESYRVQLQFPTEDLGFEYECQTFPNGPGIVRLTHIIPTGACGRAGMRPGQLLSINDVKTSSVEDLRFAVKQIQTQEMTEVRMAMLADDGDDGGLTDDVWEDENEQPQMHRRQPSRARPRGHQLSRQPSRGRPRRSTRSGSAQHRGLRRSASRGDDWGPHGGGPSAGGWGATAAAEEEALALRLQRLATLRRRGMISQAVYDDSKRQIVSQLGGGPGMMMPGGGAAAARGGGPVPDPRHAFAPPGPYARVNIPRYVFLRGAAYKGAEWVEGEGVTGLLHVARLEGGFALVRCEHTGEAGYLQTKYLDFMPPNWHPSKLGGGGMYGRAPAGRVAAPRRDQLSDIIGDDGFDDVFSYSAHSVAQPRARSVGPPAPAQLYAPVDFSGLNAAVGGAYAGQPPAGYMPPGYTPGLYDAPMTTWLSHGSGAGVPAAYPYPL